MPLPNSITLPSVGATPFGTRSAGAFVGFGAAGEPESHFMTTLLLTHADCIEHAPPEGHPERPDRLRAVEDALSHPDFDGLDRRDAPLATIDQIAATLPESEE